jgi:hypothetical protein
MRTPHSTGKQVHREIAYYDLDWSPLLPVDRQGINGSVPGLPGIWELYWLEKSRFPRLLKIGRAWYGGLRNEIRVEADAAELRNRDIAGYLTGGDCYYRYCICENAADLNEIYWVLCSLRGLEEPEAPRRRYRDIRLREPEKVTIKRRRKPSEAERPVDPLSHRVPNMFDVLEEMKRLEGETSSESEG